MIDRKFHVKMGENGLIDIKATSFEEKRNGKYLSNVWLSSLTETEAKTLIEKLKKYVED